MVLTRENIKGIERLSTADQYRLKESFTKSLNSFSASEPIIKEVSEQRHKGGYTCTHCHSENSTSLVKYSIKVGMKTMERQRYRCKDCRKTFTDVTKTPISYPPTS